MAERCHLARSGDTVTLAGRCPRTASIAVYVYRPGVRPGEPQVWLSFPQTLLATGTTVTVPRCAAQIDLFFHVEPPSVLDPPVTDFPMGYVLDALLTGTEPCSVPHSGRLPLTGMGLALVSVALLLIAAGTIVRRVRP
jgi:hypothetical protein